MTRADVQSLPLSEEVSKPAEPAPPPRGWDEGSLRAKSSLLVLVALVVGVLIGLLEVRSEHHLWALIAGLGLAGIALVALAQRWLAVPLERVLDQLERALLSGRPALFDRLPIARRDEIGRLSRRLNQMALVHYRQLHEANRLRRTLDHRIARETRRATLHLRQLAMRDPLTDLGNRRFLDMYLGPLVDSVRQARGDLACVMIDVDNFKSVNDEHGHAAGDQLLAFLGNLIRACVRAEDYAVRLGGDEFVVFLPDCETARVRQLVEHLQALFRQHVKVELPERTNVALSMGVATLGADQAKDGPDLIAKADANLYAAKGAGKGRTCGM